MISSPVAAVTFSEGPYQTDSATTLVVDDGGDAEFTSIQAAIDAASEGDTVEVRPGTYHEAITVDKNITVQAPDGATLDGTTLDTGATGIIIGSDDFFEDTKVSPTIRGFKITKYQTGIKSESDGDWMVADTTIRITQRNGIEARSNGDWVLQNVTIIETGFDGVDAGSANGFWEIRDSSITRADLDGVSAGSTFRGWTISNTTIQAELDGVEASDSSGDWVIRNTEIKAEFDGVVAADAAGDWTIQNSTIKDMPLPVDARNTLGDWQIQHSTIIESDGILATGVVINATNAVTEGEATQNWWGDASGPDADDCRGNVDCSNWLSSPPDTDESDDSDDSEGDGAQRGAAGSWSTDDGEGDVGPGATVFQGEDDINFIDANGNDLEASDFERTSGSAEGERLDMPIPEDQPRGAYENVNTGDRVTVATPRVTDLTVEDAGGTDTTGGTVTTDNASVIAEFNYEEAENLDITVEDEDGVDVTNEVVTGVVQGNDGQSDTVEWNLNLTDVNNGDYTITAVGIDDLTQDSASASTTMTIGENETIGLNANRDIVSQTVPSGESTQVTVTISAASETNDLRFTESFNSSLSASVVDDDGATISAAASNEVTASWGGVSEATITYEVTIPEDASDGATYDLSGTVEDRDAGAEATIGGDTAIEVGESSSPAAQYANDQGVVESTGLLDAAADFRSGEIDSSVLLDVAAAFRSGNPVV